MAILATGSRKITKISWLIVFLIAFTIIAGQIIPVTQAAAQGRQKVQIVTGIIEPGEIIIYYLPDLIQGQVLYVHASTLSGNLDPIIFITDTDVNAADMENDFEQVFDQAAETGADPIKTLETVRDQHALAWDDDSGGGLTAALSFEIPANGDYRLVIGGALSALGRHTFGDYRILLGLDAPQILNGDSSSTGDTIAILEVGVTPLRSGVQIFTGTLNPEKPSTFLELYDFQEGDELIAYIEATSGDLVPTIVLTNFANKPILSSNLDGKSREARLEYTFPTESRRYMLEISGCCAEANRTYGDYQLILGINAQDVAASLTDSEGRLVAREPIEVGVGLVLEQIIEVNQQSEFITAVATLRMEWTDPSQAFNPEDCHCDYKIYSEDKFKDFLSATDSKWPDFTFKNQQGNRWVQNRNVILYHDGTAIYSERFTTNFQVDFDFRQFPFDTQEFIIRIDSILPEEYYLYSNLEEVSRVSENTGEDEFILEELSVDVTRNSTNNGIVSSYVFSFNAPRHLSYYIFRIFIPILLIVLISWVTFFLKNYTHRIEVASANLLLFIAFSFSLADNYPRLGYLTFLDAVMAIMFIINALVIVYNVWLRRLEMNDKVDMLERLDDILDWVYPLIYLFLLAGLVTWFF